MPKIKYILARLIVPATTIILVTQLIFMTREITWRMILSTINDLTWWQTIMLVVFGFLSVLVTTLNDVFLAKWQNYRIEKNELYQRAWLINVFNINAGFAGTVSLLLRRILFFDQNRPNQLKPYFQMYVLSLSGLLVASVCAFIALFLKVIPGFDGSMVWLVAILIIVGIIGMISFIPGLHLWQGMKRYVAKWFIGTSCLALLLQMGLFVVIGVTIGVSSIQVGMMMLLFVIASTIAFATMTPGSWGSFDVALLLLLSNIGLSQGKAVVWLILYRVFYNLLPLLSALLLLSYRLSHKINADYRGVPHYVAGIVTHRVITLTLYLLGFLFVLSGTMPDIAQRVMGLNRFVRLPSIYVVANQLPNIVLGFLLLISARGVANQVARAYESTILVLGLVFIYILISYQYITPVIFITVLLVAFIMSKKTLYRQQFIHSWEQQVVDGIIWGVLIISYVLLGVSNAPFVQHHFHNLKHTGLMPSVHWWLTGAIVILIVSVFRVVLLRYLYAHQQQLGVSFDEERLNHMLAVGDTHYTNLAFIGDKRFYYYQVNNHDVLAVQFRIINNKAMVMGDPFGDASYYSEGMQQFVEDSDALGYIPVFYEVSERIAMLAHEFGYDFFKLGEEAQVLLDEFSTAGKKMQNIRSVVHQAARGGFEFNVLQPPFSQDIMMQLRTISDEWLAGREEKGYSLGFYDDRYIQRYPIAVLEKNSRIEAYATLVTSHTEQQMAVDLMRFTKKSPNGVMDVLFVNTIAYAKAQGLTTLNLGMSPLANVGQHRQSFGRERLANLVYQFGSKVYSFEGLHHYKSKFTKNWVPMYIAYSRKSWILMVMIGLLKIDNKGVARAPEIKVVYDKDNVF
ncbi:bifunctional lysylphosphatidylglycerol flippase/synthetase MprF [Leuconostoc sp. MS02]|uniref:Bifunctional lysylphosphatidylglycerol flippase/synthetase MprF n=1 Tax=Leuconostoc aquikimchii TaxID=3236804 RepID=A0ABV3S1A4_9LACO